METEKIEEGIDKPYSCSDGYFRRLDAVTQKMSQKEVRAIFRESEQISFEDLFSKDFSVADISLKKIKAFLQEAQTSYRISKNNLTSFLSSLGIYKKGKINKKKVIVQLTTEAQRHREKSKDKTLDFFNAD